MLLAPLGLIFFFSRQRFYTRGSKYFEAIPVFLKIRDGHNPALWMLEISTPVVEGQLGVNFADIFARSADWVCLLWW